MRAELESIRAAGASATIAEPSVAESVVLPEVALVLLVSGMTCVLARVANWGGVGTLLVGLSLLIGGCVGLALVRPTLAALVLFALAGVAVGLELLAYAGRGLYAGTVAVSIWIAGLELSGWPAGARGGLIVATGCTAGVATLVASSRSWRRTRDLPFDRSRGVLGRGAVVLCDASGAARAVVCGELWLVQPAIGELHDGDHVRVAGIHGESLLVEPTRMFSTD
jgi:membrane protein implicated in regulation of membrane protease activity